MSTSGVSLQAYLVVDNCVLVMLQEYCCERHMRRLPAAKLIPTICQWIADQLDTLKQFTPDNRVHCTDCVAGEFNPRAGRLSQLHGVGHREYTTLTNHVCSLLHQTTVDPRNVAHLRNLPAAPRKLVGPTGLSDRDLSLVVLALQLTAHGEPVYVLTNDQDLLSFITWLRPKPEVRNQWRDVRLLQGLQSLTYLELIHRDCRIHTEQMKDLLLFALSEHYAREDMAGTEKGRYIFRQLLEINTSMIQSIRIKLVGGTL
jgi:hypothetical protein